MNFKHSFRRVTEEQMENKNETSTQMGMNETSMNMAAHGDWVDLPRAKRINISPISSQLKGQPQIKLDKIAFANIEFGNRMLNVAAERIAKIALAYLHYAICRCPIS